ncbi:MAG: hypothetical protein ABL958_06890 [Bdellovibrionia bacterium]
MKAATSLLFVILLLVPTAKARFSEEVLVRGEVTGVDGKFVILALKRRLVMVPRTAILKQYSTRVGTQVIARMPASQIKVTGVRGKRK